MKILKRVAAFVTAAAGLAVFMGYLAFNTIKERERVRELPPAATVRGQPAAPPAYRAYRPPPAVPSCAKDNLRWQQDAEDMQLILALASQAQNDPLFGRTPFGMDLAECAALRWRLEGR